MSPDRAAGTPGSGTSATDIPPAPASVADRVRRSSVWSAVNTVLMRLVNIVVMAVVARLIMPEDFGVFALTLAAFGVIQSFAELGVTAALARRDLDIDEIGPTVVTIAWLTSAVFSVLLFIFAGSIAVLLGSAEATLPLQIMSVCLLLAGPVSVPSQQLQREFRGDLVFRANLVGFVFATAALLGFAFLGTGAVAFAISRVVSQVVVGVALQVQAPRFFRPGFSWTVAKRLMRFGVPISLATLLAQLLINVDTVLISQLLSVREVGVYNLAFNVGTWSMAVLQATLGAVVLPAFSQVFAGGGDAHLAMRRAVEATLVLAFPIAAVTSSLATPLVLVVYGERWVDAGPVLAVLSIYGAVSVVGLLLSDVLIAAGRTGILAIIQVGALALLVPAMWGGIAALRLEGAGLAHAAVVLVATIPFFVLALHRTIGIRPSDIIRPALRPLVGAVVAGGAGYLVTLLPWPALSQLLVGGALIGVVYLLIAGPALRRLLPDGSDSALRRILDSASIPADFVSRRRGG